MLSGKDTIAENSDEDLEATVQLEYDGRKVFTVGHDITSCTKDPGFYPLNDA